MKKKGYLCEILELFELYWEDKIENLGWSFILHILKQWKLLVGKQNSDNLNCRNFKMSKLWKMLVHCSM